MRARARLVLLGVVPIAAACATLAGAGAGDVDLPSNLVGPFRELKNAKECRGSVCTGVNELPADALDGLISVPPGTLVRAGATLRLGTGDDLHLALFAAHDVGPSPATIVRMESPDARSYAASDLSVALAADQAWEGGAIGDPWVVRAEAGVWLYYSVHPVAGQSAQTPGIARARASDAAGTSFTKDGLVTIDGPLGSWETDPPRAPSVGRDDAGRWHLFYGSGAAIGEAVGDDGLHFTRVGQAPVLSAAPPAPADLPAGVQPPFDDLAVDDPCVERVITPAGRVLWRVLYTGLDQRTGSGIGYAARYGDSGPLTRNDASVYSTKLHARAPALARFGEFALLFPTQDTTTQASWDPKKQAIGVAVTPVRVYLPMPD